MSETTARTLCPFTLKAESWVEIKGEDGTWYGKSLADGSRISAEDREGLVRAYEIQKAITMRLQDYLAKGEGTWAGALAAYKADLGEPPYHPVVRQREPFLDRVLNDLEIRARKEGR